MAKEQLKEAIREQQGGVDALTEALLPANTSLFDTDRIVPKANGGTYLIDNTRVVLPVVHMERHNILRLRTEDHDELKAIVDDRVQILKLRNKVNNQLLAAARGVDHMTGPTRGFLEAMLETVKAECGKIERRIGKWMKATDDTLINSAMGVKGVGPMSVAYMAIYADLAKARYASSLWSYVGLDKASHERYTKGEAGGGNKTLRTQLWNLADSQVKSRGAYRDVYDRCKHRLENSVKVTKTRTTEGKLIEAPWNETKPGHRHGAAMRLVVKYFLADYWFVGRTLAGLPTAPLYVEAQLGHDKPVDPDARGWVY